jgi:hypothetical protein
MVLATASKEPGWSPAATVHPPTSSTGATADETTPHQGTPRTTTTVGERHLQPATAGRAHAAAALLVDVLGRDWMQTALTAPSSPSGLGTAGSAV